MKEKTNSINIEKKDIFEHKRSFLQQKLLEWYEEKNTRHFIWRDFIFDENKKVKIDDVVVDREYAIFIAEFMLIRTKAEQVEPVYIDFLKQFKSFKDILESDLTAIECLVGKLGLHRRQQQLLKIAKVFYTNDLPDNFNDLLQIEGIGPYAASAFLCFTKNQKISLVDNNFVRFYCRFFGIAERTELRRKKIFIDFCSSLLPDIRYREFNIAVLDIGATICLINPVCEKCPVKENCEYFSFLQKIDIGFSLLVLPLFDRNCLNRLISHIIKVIRNKRNSIVIISLISLGKEIKNIHSNLLKKTVKHQNIRIHSSDKSNEKLIPCIFTSQNKMYFMKSYKVNEIVINNLTLAKDVQKMKFWREKIKKLSFIEKKKISFP
jgi:A/G-specific adenine glycosylase